MKAIILQVDVILKGDTVMFDAQKYIQEFENAGNGNAKIYLIKKAIEAACEAKSPEWQFIFMHECIKESVFKNDAVDAMIIFPQMVEVFDKNTDIQDEYQYDLMWSYKYILENFSDFYNVSYEQIEKLFDDFDRRCKLYGYSQRASKYLREKMSVNTGNVLPPEKYDLFLDEPLDDLKDCKACECSFRVISALATGNLEKAKYISRPIIDGTLHCQEVPQLTYNGFIEYYLEKGDYDEAINYARRLYPMVKGNIDMLNVIGTLLCLYSQTSLYNAVYIFRRELSYFIKCKNHKAKFMFANGAYRIFKKYTESPDEQYKQIKIKLPQDFELYSSNDKYSASELKDYFYNIASYLAEKFDKRNQNCFMSDKLKVQYSEYSSDKSENPVHCYTEYVPSLIASVCRTPDNIMSFDQIKQRISEKFTIDDVFAEDNIESLQLKISDNNEQYHVVLSYQPLVDPSEFRPVHYVDPDCFRLSENMLLSLVMFNEKPDLSLQFQLKLLTAIDPDAIAYLDMSRQTVLSAQWVRLQCTSSTSPLISYLYGLRLISTPESDKVWISTTGLNCCGIKEISVFDATKENYQSFCDLICFIAEGAILRQNINDSKEICNTLLKGDNTAISITWLPFSEAKEYYSEEDVPSSLDMCPDDVSNSMVLFEHSGEDESGQSVLNRLGEMNSDELSKICYGVYVDSENKDKIYTKERYNLFCTLVSKYPDNAYAYIVFHNNSCEDSTWIRITECYENKIKGIVSDDCSLGKKGDEIEVPASDMINFRFDLKKTFIDPDSAYLADVL